MSAKDKILDFADSFDEILTNFRAVHGERQAMYLQLSVETYSLVVGMVGLVPPEARLIFLEFYGRLVQKLHGLAAMIPNEAPITDAVVWKQKRDALTDFYLVCAERHEQMQRALDKERE